MAENVKQIQEFPQKTDFGDDDLLLIQGSGTTYNVQGRAVKKYAEDAAKPQVELAAGQAQAAEEAANRAEAAIVHPPIPDPATGNWMRWDQLTEEYVVTDIRAEGQDFEIRGFYPSFEALQEAVPDPKKGWAYGIGTEAPYEIYVWDAVGGDWKNNGPMTATGDMLRSTYDPQHKGQDIFAYSDGVKVAALTAIAAAKEGLSAEDARLDAALQQKAGRMELISTSTSGNGSFLLSAPILYAPKKDWNQYDRVIFFQDFHKTQFKNDEFIHIGLNLDGVIHPEKLIIPAGSFMVVCFPNHNAEGMIRLVIVGKGTGTFFLDRKYDDLRFINSVLYNSQGNPPSGTRFVEPVAYVYGIR